MIFHAFIFTLLTLGAPAALAADPGLACTSSTIAIGHRPSLGPGRGYGFCAPDEVPNACVPGYEKSGTSCIKLPTMSIVSANTITIEEGGAFDVTVRASRAVTSDRQLVLTAIDEQNILNLPAQGQVVMPAGQREVVVRIQTIARNLISPATLNLYVTDVETGIPGVVSLPATITPSGLPAVTAISVANPVVDIGLSSIQSTQVTVSLNKPLSYFFSNKITLAITNENSIVKNGAQRLTLTVAKGATTASAALELSGTASSKPAIITLAPASSVQLAPGTPPAQLSVIDSRVVVHTYTAQFSEYLPVNTFTSPCAGSAMASRSILSCRDENGSLVSNTLCSDPTPNTGYQSPAGQVTQLISNGRDIFECAQGSTQRLFVERQCDQNYELKNGVCSLIQGPVETYLVGFSPYEANNVTAVCSGVQVASRSIVECRRASDEQPVALSFCTDPAPTITYKSPAGSTTLSISGGIETYTCAQGSSMQVFQSRSCDQYHYDNLTGCAPESYIASFSAYDSNQVSAICAGTQEAHRSILSCAKMSNGESVSTSLCSDPAPSISYKSPAGSLTSQIPYGELETTCAEGSVDQQYAAHCLYGQPDAGLNCPAPVYLATYSAYAPANTFTAICSGQGTATRTITSCTLQNDGSSVDISLCSDAQPIITYQSPAGSGSDRVTNGTQSYTCAQGSQTKVLTSLVCDYEPAVGGVCPAIRYISAVSWPTNTLPVCGGSQIVTSTITSCTQAHDGASVSISLCGAAPTTTYQSPAGSINALITGGSIQYACAQGSTDQVKTGITCDSGYAPNASSDACVQTAVTRQVQIQKSDVSLVEVNAQKASGELLNCPAATSFSAPTYCTLNLDVTQTYTFKASGRSDFLFRGPLVQNTRNVSGDSLFDISTASLSSGQVSVVKISRNLTFNKLSILDAASAVWTVSDGSGTSYATCPAPAFSCVYEIETLKSVLFGGTGAGLYQSGGVTYYQASGGALQSSDYYVADGVTQLYDWKIGAFLGFTADPSISIAPASPRVFDYQNLSGTAAVTTITMQVVTTPPTTNCVVVQNPTTLAILKTVCEPNTQFKYNHSVQVTGLVGNTSYNVWFSSTDQFGRTGTSSVRTIKTSR